MAEKEIQRRGEYYRAGATAVVFNERREFLLVYLDDGIVKGWVLPSGGFEPEDETYHNTALRELREEVGLEARQVKYLTSIADIEHAYVYTFPAHQRDYWHSRGSRYVGQIKFFFFFELADYDATLTSEESQIKQFKWMNMADAKDNFLNEDQYAYLAQMYHSNISLH